MERDSTFSAGHFLYHNDSSDFLRDVVRLLDLLAGFLATLTILTVLVVYPRFCFNLLHLRSIFVIFALASVNDLALILWAKNGLPVDLPL